jgi:hypothetical protein
MAWVVHISLYCPKIEVPRFFKLLRMKPKYQTSVTHGYKLRAHVKLQKLLQNILKLMSHITS